MVRKRRRRRDRQRTPGGRDLGAISHVPRKGAEPFCSPHHSLPPNLIKLGLFTERPEFLRIMGEMEMLRKAKGGRK